MNIDTRLRGNQSRLNIKNVHSKWNAEPSLGHSKTTCCQGQFESLSPVKKGLIITPYYEDSIGESSWSHTIIFNGGWIILTVRSTNRNW